MGARQNRVVSVAVAVGLVVAVQAIWARPLKTDLSAYHIFAMPHANLQNYQLLGACGTVGQQCVPDPGDLKAASGFPVPCPACDAPNPVFVLANGSTTCAAIDEFTPTTARVGDRITMSSTCDLNAATGVLICGITANIVSQTASMLVVEVPAGAAGACPVQVQSASGVFTHVGTLQVS